ncbi:M56 family metallopeptidase [Sphingomicrobium nitratireducens]|uniref:M56 family metallopeptidase n=1 Tax=Sphingomicrobium nitratireducens TaxID=2964666 RepID=UPI002240A368|nr:M56 family metallopeptidase [Sphingomicrobium nitratireducens]
MTDWLLDTLIATTALMVLVLMLRAPVRRQFGAGAAYALWALPAARAVMPTLTHTVERAAPVLPAAETVPAATPIVGLSLAPAAHAATAIPDASPSLIEQLGGWPTLLLIAWLVGAGALFANRMHAYMTERRHILGVAHQVGKVGSVRIVESDAVHGPIAFGVLDRVIALPPTFNDHYSRDERRLALAHELAHHKSGDLVANFFAFVLLSLQWFNPLAWMSYAAFRFDQEAACDARVLDDAGDDRVTYGRAIAKAASGRALMFASALDDRNTLKRRLREMMNHTTRGRRMAGKLLVIGCVALALPLTATKAIEYVDVPKPPAPPAAPAAPKAPKAPLAPLAPTAPVAPIAAMQSADGHVFIDGQHKKYSEMTAEERREFDEGMAEMREALEDLQRERLDVRAEIAEAMAEARNEIDRDEIRREMEEARAEIAEAMAEIDAERDQIIADGGDPEAIKASIRAAMASVEAMDIDAIVEGAMASVNEAQIEAQVEASLAQAEASIRQSLTQMEQAKRQ